MPGSHGLGVLQVGPQLVGLGAQGTQLGLRGRQLAPGRLKGAWPAKAMLRRISNLSTYMDIWSVL